MVSLCTKHGRILASFGALGSFHVCKELLSKAAGKSMEALGSEDHPCSGHYGIAELHRELCSYRAGRTGAAAAGALSRAVLLSTLQQHFVPSVDALHSVLTGDLLETFSIT